MLTKDTACVITNGLGMAKCCAVSRSEFNTIPTVWNCGWTLMSWCLTRIKGKAVPHLDFRTHPQTRTTLPRPHVKCFVPFPGLVWEEASWQAETHSEKLKSIHLVMSKQRVSVEWRDTQDKFMADRSEESVWNWHRIRSRLQRDSENHQEGRRGNGTKAKDINGQIIDVETWSPGTSLERVHLHGCPEAHRWNQHAH